MGGGLQQRCWGRGGGQHLKGHLQRGGVRMQLRLQQQGSEGWGGGGVGGATGCNSGDREGRGPHLAVQAAAAQTAAAQAANAHLGMGVAAATTSNPLPRASLTTAPLPEHHSQRPLPEATPRIVIAAKIPARVACRTTTPSSDAPRYPHHPHRLSAHTHLHLRAM